MLLLTLKTLRMPKNTWWISSASRSCTNKIADTQIRITYDMTEAKMKNFSTGDLVLERIHRITVLLISSSMFISPFSLSFSYVSEPSSSSEFSDSLILLFSVWCLVLSSSSLLCLVLEVSSLFCLFLFVRELDFLRELVFLGD